MCDLQVSCQWFSNSLPSFVKNFNHHFPFWLHSLGGICYTIFFLTLSLISWSVTLCVMNIASVAKWWNLSQTMNSPWNMFGTPLKKRKTTCIESIVKSLSKTLFSMPNTTFIKKIRVGNLWHYTWLALPVLLLSGKFVLSSRGGFSQNRGEASLTRRLENDDVVSGECIVEQDLPFMAIDPNFMDLSLDMWNSSLFSWILKSLSFLIN